MESRFGFDLLPSTEFNSLQHVREGERVGTGWRKYLILNNAGRQATTRDPCGELFLTGMAIVTNLRRGCDFEMQSLNFRGDLS